MQILAPIGFAILCFLPGAWLTFSLRLPGVGLGVRALLAVVVSPVVVLAQFYTIRLVGASFSATILILLLGNLPALYLVYRRCSPWPRVDVAGSVPYLFAFAIPLIVLFAVQTALRGHPFLHADIVYGLANGFLKVEEAQLAGTTAGYPWGGHVLQAALSWVLGGSPIGNYRWTNFVWLIAGLLLLAQVTGSLGGGLRARVLTVLWALFAVNAVGYVLGDVLIPRALTERYPVFGDFSYTPVLRKYALWNQHPFGHGLFAGILFFMVRDDSEAFSKSAIALVSVMVVGLAVIFPTFMPAVAAVLFARFAIDLYRRRSKVDREFAFRLVRSLGTVALIGAAATFAVLVVVGEHRAEGTGLAISSAWELKKKFVEIIVVLSPLLVGSLLLYFARRNAPPDRSAVLSLGGVLSAVLYVVFALTNGIEYKLVFTAMLCLVPPACIGFDTLLAGRGRVREGIYALLMLFFIGAGSYLLIRDRRTGPTPFAIGLADFRVRLPVGHELSASVDAIARGTAPKTVVVVDSLDVHLPVFVQRSMYAPPHTNALLYGVGMQNRFVLGVNRGYGYKAVDQRLAVTRQLFRSHVANERLQALKEIQRLERPTAVLLDLSRHSGLLGTLMESRSGKMLHQDPRWAVWLWEF